MALTTYTNLVAEIGDWLDDAGLSSKADTFIRMAEARFNRVIRHIDMEGFTTLALTGETVDLPADCLQIKIMWIDGAPDDQLEELSLSALKALYGGQAGVPKAYAITGGSIFFGPVPTTGNVQVTYYQKLTGLSATNASNWLLASHPDIYLYACLTMAEARGWNDGRLPLLKGALDEALRELTLAGTTKRYGGAPLQARSVSVA